MTFVIEVKFGLANRIRTMLGYLYIARKKKVPLMVAWIPYKGCPGHFLDYWEPVPGIQFLRVNQNARFDRLKHTPGIEFFQGQTYMSKIGKKYGYKIDDKAIAELYTELKLKPKILEKINAFSTKFNIPGCIGLHIRRTDHPNVAKHWMKKYTTDQEFHTNIECDLIENPDQQFFLATDNYQSQHAFAKQYPKKMIVYEVILPNKKFRQTTLEHAVIDVYLLARCKKLHGSFFSSYTTLAERIKETMK